MGLFYKTLRFLKVKTVFDEIGRKLNIDLLKNICLNLVVVELSFYIDLKKSK